MEFLFDICIAHRPFERAGGVHHVTCEVATVLERDIDMRLGLVARSVGLRRNLAAQFGDGRFTHARVGKLRHTRRAVDECRRYRMRRTRASR